MSCAIGKWIPNPNLCVCVIILGPVAHRECSEAPTCPQNQLFIKLRCQPPCGADWLREFLLSPDFAEISGIQWNLGEFGKIREISGKFRWTQWNSVGFCMALSMNSVGIPGGFRGNAGFSRKLGVWGGFGWFGGSKGFCANSPHAPHPASPPRNPSPLDFQIRGTRAPPSRRLRNRWKIENLSRPSPNRALFCAKYRVSSKTSQDDGNSNICCLRQITGKRARKGSPKSCVSCQLGLLGLCN